MTLSDWLSRTGTSAAALAERCGVHPLTIYKWKDGVNVPRQARLAALTEATGGAVTANDFHPPAVAGSDRQEAPGAATGHGLGALVREAEALGIDGDAVCRNALRAAIGDARAARWTEENRDAIEAHARYIEEHGTPLGKYRMF